MMNCKCQELFENVETVLWLVLEALNEKDDKALKQKQLAELNEQLEKKYEVATKLQKSISKYPEVEHLWELQELIWDEIADLELKLVELEMGE
jgi:hypothetical protein